MASSDLVLRITAPWWTPIYLVFFAIYLTLKGRSVDSLTREECERAFAPIIRRLRVIIPHAHGNALARWFDRQALQSQIDALERVLMTTDDAQLHAWCSNQRWRLMGRQRALR